MGLSALRSGDGGAAQGSPNHDGTTCTIGPRANKSLRNVSEVAQTRGQCLQERI